jgi:hypothetical protein
VFRPANALVKKIVYTAVTDGYEVHPVLVDRRGWDFVCFAETAITSAGWTVVTIPASDIVVEDELMANDRSKTSKRVKLLPHRYLPGCDLSIWIDSSMQFKAHIDLDSLCADFVNSAALLRLRSHPYRHCIYREAKEILKCKLDTPRNVDRLIARYRGEGFPENLGLAESNFLLRKHIDLSMIAFSEAWWQLVKTLSRRDQLTFNYLLWKKPIPVDFIDDRVAPGLEARSRGRDRGAFFNETFNFIPTRGR